MASKRSCSKLKDWNACSFLGYDPYFDGDEPLVSNRAV
jgi:hypothetical protein